MDSLRDAAGAVSRYWTWLLAGTLTILTIVVMLGMPAGSQAQPLRSAATFESAGSTQRAIVPLDRSGADVLASVSAAAAPPMWTQVTSPTVFSGQEIMDVGVLTGTGISGTLTFFVCGPAAGAPDCSTGGTQVGGPISLTVGATDATAVSTPFSTTLTGWYCFRAEYTPGGGSTWLPGSHTNLTSECFEVLSPSRLIIRKETIGGDGPFVFTTSLPLSPTVVLTTTGGSGSFTITNLLPRTTVSLAEMVPPGWELYGTFCDNEDSIDSVRIRAGDITCTFYNYKFSRLNIRKVSIGDIGTFEFEISASEFFRTAQVTTTIPGTPVTTTLYLYGDTYAVTETVPAGWILTGATCDGGLSPAAVVLDDGQAATCTFTNTKLSRIAVDKVTAPSGDPQNFNFALNGPGLSQSFVLADATAPFVTGFLTPGLTYSVTESTAAGWSQTGATCSGTGNSPGTIIPAAGQTVTCTFTNTRPATLTVIKTVTNDNGGTLGPAAFSIHVRSNEIDVAGSPQPGSSSGTSYTLLPGTYQLTEDLPNTQYARAGITGGCGSNGSVTLSAGQSVTCTIVNDDIAPTLTVINLLSPVTDTGLVNLLIDGAVVASNVGHNGSTGAVTVNAGPHTVSETAGTGTTLSQYTAQFGGACSTAGSVTIALGQNLTCTITNARIATEPLATPVPTSTATSTPSPTRTPLPCPVLTRDHIEFVGATSLEAGIVKIGLYGGGNSYPFRISLEGVDPKDPSWMLLDGRNSSLDGVTPTEVFLSVTGTPEKRFWGWLYLDFFGKLPSQRIGVTWGANVLPSALSFPATPEARIAVQDTNPFHPPTSTPLAGCPTQANSFIAIFVPQGFRAMQASW